MRTLSTFLSCILLLLIFTSVNFPQDIIFNYDVDVFPNPFSDKLQIEVSSKSAGSISISLWNVSGQKIAKIFQYNCNNPPCGRAIWTYNVPSYPSRVYFYVTTLNNTLINVGKLVLVQSK